MNSQRSLLFMGCLVLIRFWATPDQPGTERDAVWAMLLKAGVDLVNTDDLTGLRAFISAHDQ